MTIQKQHRSSVPQITRHKHAIQFDIFMSVYYIIYMRTTIRIDDTLLQSAKKEALTRNISLTKLIEESLKDTLYKRKSVKSNQRVKLVTVSGNGLQPGIDIDDSAGLLDAMDE